MKIKNLLLSGLFIGSASFNVCLGYANSNSVPPKGGKPIAPQAATIDLKPVVEEINLSLIDVHAAKLPYALKSAAITFETITTKSAGGGFKIFVKASKKWTKESSTSYTFNWEKKDKIDKSALAVRPLAQLIIDAVNKYKESGDIIGLQKNGFDIELSFSITKTTEAGFEIELFTVELEGGADFEKKVFHKIALSFE